MIASMRLREVVNAHEVNFDMCQFGMTAMSSRSGGFEGPAKKPTKVITNSAAIDGLLDRRCPGDHTHILLETGRAKEASKYPEELQDTFIDGLLMEEMHEQRTTAIRNWRWRSGSN